MFATITKIKIRASPTHTVSLSSTLNTKKLTADTLDQTKKLRKILLTSSSKTFLSHLSDRISMLFHPLREMH
jgi:hypothetical protein